MKRAEDLKPGDEIVQDGVRFIVKETAPLPDGKTAVYFEDMPATEEVTAAFRKLTEAAGGTGFLPPVRVEQKGWKNSKMRQFLVQDFEKILKLHQGEKMEVRDWMYIAVAWGGRLRGNMVPNKAYLYELHTETFVQFDSTEYAESFIKWAKVNIDHWGHNPIALLDTGDPEVRERWAGHMAKPETLEDKIVIGMVRELETGATPERLRPTFAPGEVRLGSMRWWMRTPMRRREVVVMVEDGRVSEVFSNIENLMVSVLDTDTDDPERKKEIDEEKAALQARIDSGELKRVP